MHWHVCNVRNLQKCKRTSALQPPLDCRNLNFFKIRCRRLKALKKGTLCKALCYCSIPEMIKAGLFTYRISCIYLLLPRVVIRVSVCKNGPVKSERKWVNIYDAFNWSQTTLTGRIFQPYPKLLFLSLKHSLQCLPNSCPQQMVKQARKWGFVQGAVLWFNPWDYTGGAIKFYFLLVGLLL